MSERFAKKWESRREENSVTDTIRNVVNPPPPLKPRMELAVRRLDLQINKLVDAYTKHDTAHANIYANELAEVRKMAKLVMNARLALDQVALRIRTCTEFGDLVANLGPAIGVLRSVSSCLTGVVPEAEGLNSGSTMNFNNVSEDAAKILNEAAAVAEQKVSANFPELPPGLPANHASLKTPQS